MVIRSCGASLTTLVWGSLWLTEMSQNTLTILDEDLCHTMVIAFDSLMQRSLDSRCHALLQENIRGQQGERGGGDALSRVAQCIDKQHKFTVVLVKQRGPCDSIPPTQPPLNHLICCDKNRLESPTCSQTTHCLHSINLWKLCLCLHISHMLTHRTSLELLPLQTHLHI